jgi:CTP-dependent riboflavin kinase
MTSGKKFVPIIDTLPYTIMASIGWGTITNRMLYKHLKISKQKLQYWLEKLLSEGLIERPHQGLYQLSRAGKKLLGTYAKERNKHLIRLENMRYKYPILMGVKTLISWISNPSKQSMNNMTIHHGKLKGFTVRVFDSSHNPSIEITCKQKIGTDIYEMHYQARNEVEAMILDVKGHHGIVLGAPEPAMEPEWAIESPIAETVLAATCSSQIRTPKGTLNRSKGRNADLETRDIRLAHDILAMPETIQEIWGEIKEIRTALFGEDVPLNDMTRKMYS